LTKASDERFKEYISPVLFWVLTVLFPFLMLIDLISALPGSRVSTEKEWIAFMKTPFSTRLVLISLVALSGPLAISSRSLKALRKPIDRETLRLPFFVQCYCLTPVYVCLMPLVFTSLRYSDTPAGPATYVEAASLIIAGSWFLSAESAVLSEQLSISRGKAGIRAAGYVASAFIFLFLLELAAITVFNGLSVWVKALIESKAL
jgi:hypothetical protein